MKKVKCINCNKIIEVVDEEIIATVCGDCIKLNLEKKLKNITYKDIDKLTSKDGRQVNEFGEII